jgi:hypothetical protein
MRSVILRDVDRVTASPGLHRPAELDSERNHQRVRCVAAVGRPRGNARRRKLTD